MAITATHYIVTLQAASSGGSANPAQVDFDLPAGTSDEEAATAFLCYFQFAIYMHTGCAVVRVQKRTPGMAGNVDVPFPSTNYAAAYTVIGAPLVAMFGFGVSAPVGTSYTVSEYTGLPGRSYTGRHYLPFVSSGSIDSNGFVPSVNIAAVEQAYRDAFLGDTYPSELPALSPVVVSKKLNLQTTILTPKCSSTPANLKTRRR